MHLIATHTKLLLIFAFVRLLITLANSLDPDQARQHVGPDLDPKLFDTLMVFLKEFFEKVDFEKISRREKKHEWSAVAQW